MTLQLLELNDNGVALGGEDGVLLTSAGFALAKEKEVLLGNEARAQSRLHPNQSHSRYWQDLSLEPLPSGRLPNENLRHSADLAHAHLQAIAEQSGGEPRDVVLSVPSSFSRQQLGILLGVAKKTPLRVVSLVDSALLAAASAPAEGATVVVQQQLHQTLISLVEWQGGRLKVEASVALPSTGSENVIDALMQFSTELFIEQCRFNPQHDAPTEQLLYNALPNWLRAAASGENMLLELAADGALHGAKLPYQDLLSALAPTREKIAQQLHSLLQRSQSAHARIVVCPPLGGLPGMTAELASHAELVRVTAVNVAGFETSIASCFAHRDQLVTGAPLGLHKQLAVDAGMSRAAPRREGPRARFTLDAQTATGLRLNGNPVRLAEGDALVVAQGDTLGIMQPDGSIASLVLESFMQEEVSDGEG